MSDLRTLPVVVLAVAAVVVSSGTDGAQDLTASGVPGEVHQMLGDGVVSAIQPVAASSDPFRAAHWQPGEWTYRITSGDRGGQTEREVLQPIDATARRETWVRTIGKQYTLYIGHTADGGLVLPSEIAHEHKAVVYFEPPLTYLLATLPPGEARAYDGKMNVYRVSDPGTRWYSGRIRATTVNAGAYRVTTPAGTFSAVLVRTDYKIDIFAVVSVTDSLYTFYAEGIGKVAEAERQRISAFGLFNSDSRIGKVLIAYTPAMTLPPVEPIQAP